MNNEEWAEDFLSEAAEMPDCLDYKVLKAEIKDKLWIRFTHKVTGNKIFLEEWGGVRPKDMNKVYDSVKRIQMIGGETPQEFRERLNTERISDDIIPKLIEDARTRK